MEVDMRKVTTGSSTATETNEPESGTHPVASQAAAGAETLDYAAMASKLGELECAVQTANEKLDGVTLAIDNWQATEGIDGGIEQEDMDAIIDGVRAARSLVRYMGTGWLPALRKAMGAS
jgi:hypothetical protein